MANDHKMLLEVRGLTKTYPGFQLKPLSFSLEAGKITGFIGRNGAGKTTTINSILSFIRPDAGEVLFSGLPRQENARDVLEKIGFVSAGMTYYTRKKLKIITGVTRTFYPGWDETVYRDYMSSFGLSEEKTPAELSNGMKIKYVLPLALSHGAELLILDEPTSGLDPVSRDELTEVFLRLRDRGKAVFFREHQIYGKAACGAVDVENREIVGLARLQFGFEHKIASGATVVVIVDQRHIGVIQLKHNVAVRL